MASWRSINPVIEGRLFLGTIDAAKSSRTLTERCITHIVSLGNEPIPADRPDSGIRQLRIPVEEVSGADLLIWLPVACKFINEALAGNGVVLVQCATGLSRSAAVVSAYLMYSRKISPSLAMDTVRRAREQIWIHPTFQEQLVIFECCQYAPTPSEGIYKKWRQRVTGQRQ